MIYGCDLYIQITEFSTIILSRVLVTYTYMCIPLCVHIYIFFKHSVPIVTRLPTHDKLEKLTYKNLRFIISIEEIGIKLYGYWGKKTTTCKR